MTIITLGTRGSKLALVQTELVRAALQRAHPQIQTRIETITTKGDIVLDRPLSAIGDKGLFVTEIEEALRQRRIDLAVHSAKDLPSQLPPDMRIAAYAQRADPRDVLITYSGERLDTLPADALVGTSSLRRACQLQHMRPDLRIADLRGNVDTRLRKLHEGQYDAIILAAAGLQRLGLTAQVTEWLQPDRMIPAVAQGALAIEVRSDDQDMLALLAPLNDQETHLAVTAERAFLACIGGGCQLPIGAYAQVDGTQLRIIGMIGTSEGRMVRGELQGQRNAPEELGVQLAAQLREELRAES